MQAPVTKTLSTIYTNSSYSLQLQIFSATNIPLDLTGYPGVYSSIYSNTTPPRKLTDFTVVINTANQGLITISLTPAQTNSIQSVLAGAASGSVNYDILIKQPDGEQYYWVKGTIPVIVGYTTISS